MAGTVEIVDVAHHQHHSVEGLHAVEELEHVVAGRLVDDLDVRPEEPQLERGQAIAAARCPRSTTTVSSHRMSAQSVCCRFSFADEREPRLLRQILGTHAVAAAQLDAYPKTVERCRR